MAGLAAGGQADVLDADSFGAAAQLVERMKSLTTAASSGPLFSWRKWRSPVMVVWGWPWAPGMRLLRALWLPLASLRYR
jgi:hypothetical protein